MDQRRKRDYQGRKRDHQGRKRDHQGRIRAHQNRKLEEPAWKQNYCNMANQVKARNAVPSETNNVVQPHIDSASSFKPPSSASTNEMTSNPAQDAVRVPTGLPVSRDSLSSSVPTTLGPGRKSIPLPVEMRGFITSQASIKKNLQQKGALQPTSVTPRSKEGPVNKSGAEVSGRLSEVKSEPHYSRESNVSTNYVPSSIVEKHGNGHEKSDGRNKEHRKSELSHSKKETSARKETNTSTEAEKNSERKSKSSEKKSSEQKSSSQFLHRSTSTTSTGKTAKPQETPSKPNEPETKRKFRSPSGLYQDRNPKKSSDFGNFNGFTNKTSVNNSERQRSKASSETSRSSHNQRSQPDSTQNHSTKTSVSSHRDESGSRQSSSSNDRHTESSSKLKSKEKHVSSSRTNERDGHSSHLHNDLKAEKRSTSLNKSHEMSKKSESRQKPQIRQIEESEARGNIPAEKKYKTTSRCSEEDDMTRSPTYRVLANARAADVTRVLSMYQAQVPGPTEAVQPKESRKQMIGRCSLGSSSSSSQEDGPTPPAVVGNYACLSPKLKPKGEAVSASLRGRFTPDFSSSSQLMDFKKRPALTKKDTSMEVKNEEFVNHEEEVQNGVCPEKTVPTVTEALEDEVEPATNTIEGLLQHSDEVPQNWMKGQQEHLEQSSQLAEQPAGSSTSEPKNHASVFKSPILSPEVERRRRRASDGSVATHSHSEKNDSEIEETLGPVDTQKQEGDSTKRPEQDSPPDDTPPTDTPVNAVQPQPQPVESIEVLNSDVQTTAQNAQFPITFTVPAVVPTKMASVIKYEDVIASQSNSWKIEPYIPRTDQEKPTQIDLEDTTLGLSAPAIVSIIDSQ